MSEGCRPSSTSHLSESSTRPEHGAVSLEWTSDLPAVSMRTANTGMP